MTVTQRSQDLSKNSTIVDYRLEMNRPSYVSSSTNKSYSIRVNGSTVKSGTTKIGGSGTLLIASGQTSVTHDSDGEKELTFGFTFTYDITWAGVHLGTATKDGKMRLTTIPRATTPTLDKKSADLGTTITISLKAASSNFKHKLYHDFFVGEWTSMNSGNYYGSNASAGLAMPLNWAERMNMVNQTQGNGRILCETYDSSNKKIGEVIVQFTATVPSSVVPTISNLSITDSDAAINSKFGSFIQSKSKPKVDITASGAYGSTITAYTTTIGGTSYNGSSFTGNTINTSGEVTIETTVIDSRGRRATMSKTINVTPYAPPTISSFTASRCTSSGSADNNGTYVKLNISSTISSLNNKNTHTYGITYKASDSTSWSSLVSSSTSIDYEANLSLIKTISGGFSTTKSYIFKLVIYDYFSDNSKSVSVQTSFILMNFHPAGNSIAFGKASSKTNALESDLPFYFYKDIYLGNYPLTASFIEEIKDGLNILNYLTEEVVRTHNQGSPLIHFGHRNTSISNATSVTLFTKSNLETAFGLGTGQTTYLDYYVVVNNMNGNNISAHVDGVTYINGTWFAVLDRSASGTINLNYMVVYCKNS